MIQGIIYKWTNLKNNKVYIGKTTREKERYYEHLHDRRKDLPFHRALDKYGKDNFRYEVIFCTKSNSHDNLNVVLNTLERYYIKKFKANNKHFGYNLTEGGDGLSGYKMTEEHKKNISTSSIGHQYRGVGKGNYKHSDETKKLLSNKKLGIKNEHFYKPVSMYDLEGNHLMDFNSIHEARLYIDGGTLKGGSKHISDVCKGIRSNCSGYKWQYKI